MPKTSDTEYLSFPILLGDIGGTNARFSILIDSFAEPVHLTTVKTAEYPGIDDAIQQAVLDKTSLQPVSTILAIAGPIEGDEIPLTNCHWVVKPKDMLAKLGLKDVIVINDFEAQALAIAALDDDNREPIGSGKRTCWRRASFLDRARGLASPGWSMPAICGFRCLAKAGISILAREARATMRFSPYRNHRGPRRRRTDPVRTRAGQSLSRRLQGRRHRACLLRSG